MVNTNLLKGAIASAGYTQRSLAPLVNMSENSLNAKVNGRKDFTLSEVFALCQTLAITDPEKKVNIFLPHSSQ